MTALSANKDVKQLDAAFQQRLGNFGNGTLDSGVTFYKGALVAWDQNDSTIKPAETSTTLIALGVSQDAFTEGASGAPTSINVLSGIFLFENSAAGDAITAADAGNVCYIVDDQTVAKTDGTSTRSAAGKVVAVTSDGVYVAVNPL